MEPIIRDVNAIDAAHRRALEDVLGRPLHQNERLVISVLELKATTGSAAAKDRPAQTVDEWAKVLEGLSEEEIERIDEVAKARANLTRDAQ
jgi:hypothetical protein